MYYKDYTPPLFFSNGHIQSIYPTIFRKFDTSFYTRERIDTPDDDFLDLDWSLKNSNHLVIISHGLEGHSKRAYVLGMVRALNKSGRDCLAWNYRTCGGEPNKKLRMYHNGTTDDLDTVIQHAMSKKKYRSISLIGFSMGGNLNLIYLGQRGSDIHPIIKKAVFFSVPCDLEGSADMLNKKSNRIFMNRFLKMLHKKIKAKAALMPDLINDKDYDKIKNFKEFDDRYTAPIHGFKNAEDYWKKCSSLQYIPKIKIPTLIVNAENDPFLSDSCYPINEVKDNNNVILEIPKSGGHVGFIEFNKENLYWSEKRTIKFFEKI